jgi:hypothetical protein
MSVRVLRLTIALRALTFIGTAALTLGPVSAIAAPTRSQDPRLKGVTGDGRTDDAPALQAAIDAASSAPGGVLQLPPGVYRVHSPIRLKSNVVLAGTGRHWGTQVIPVGCPAFVIDGSGANGGWVFRIRIQDLTIDARKAAGPAVIDVNAAYNVELEDLFIYSTGGTVIDGVRVRASNDIVLRDLVAYAANSSGGHGVLLDGSSGAVSAKLFAPDVETYNRAIQAQGDVTADVYAPYVERAVIAYAHQISAGHVSIFGGLLSSVNGYPLYVYGDNLSVYGTDLDPRTGPDRGGLGIYTPSAGAYRNVNLYDIPRMAQPGFVRSDANWLQLHTTVSPVPGLLRRTIDLLPHTIANRVATPLARLERLQWARCKLTLHGFAGDARIVQEFEFTVKSASSASRISAVPALTEGGAPAISLSVAAAPIKDGVQLSVTPALQPGPPLTLYGDLEIVAISPALGGVYVQ